MKEGRKHSPKAGKPLQKSLNSCKGIGRQKIECYITIGQGKKKHDDTNAV